MMDSQQKIDNTDLKEANKIDYSTYNELDMQTAQLMQVLIVSKYNAIFGNVNPITASHTLIH
jgi:hypothetical protein